MGFARGPRPRHDRSRGGPLPARHPRAAGPAPALHPVRPPACPAPQVPALLGGHLSVATGLGVAPASGHRLILGVLAGSLIASLAAVAARARVTADRRPLLGPAWPPPPCSSAAWPWIRCRSSIWGSPSSPEPPSGAPGPGGARGFRGFRGHPEGGPSAMAIHNLVVQCLSEEEMSAAGELLGKHGPVTRSGMYVYGAGDEADVQALEARGLSVDEIPAVPDLSWLDPGRAGGRPVRGAPRRRGRRAVRPPPGGRGRRRGRLHDPAQGAHPRRLEGPARRPRRRARGLRARLRLQGPAHS